MWQVSDHEFFIEFIIISYDPSVPKITYENGSNSGCNTLREKIPGAEFMSGIALSMLVVITQNS